MDEVDLFDRADIELQQGRTNTTHLRLPEVGVVTGIRGGMQSGFEKRCGERGTHDNGSSSSGDEIAFENKSKGIMTTVRIEQSYV